MADLNRTISIIFQGESSGAVNAAQSLGEKLDALGLRGMKAADALGALAAKEKEAADASQGAAGGLKTFDDAIVRSAALTDNSALSFGNLRTVIASLGIAAVVREFIEANVQLERTTLALRAVTGDSATAAKELDFIRDVSNRLGLNIGDAASAYTKLSAASRGTSLEGEQTRAIFESVAGAAAKLGLSAADTEGVLRAVEQIVSKNTVQAEELRGQIGDRLPGAFAIAARAMGVTTEELNTLLKSGSVVAGDFLPKFAAELDRTFGKTEQVDTYSAAITRLGNALTLAFQGIGERSGGLGTQALDLLGRAAREVGLEVENQVGSWKNLFDVLRGGSWDTFVERQKRMGLELEGTAAVLDLKYNQTLAETNRLLRQTAEATKAAFEGDQTDAETARLRRQNDAISESLRNKQAAAEALKTLGVDAKKFANDFEQVAQAVEALFKNPAARGEQAMAGFEAALKRVRTSDDLNRIGPLLAEAFARGDLSAQEFNRAVADLVKTQERLGKSSGDTSRSIEGQAKRTRDAEKAAQDFQVRMEQIASNERIKFIESKVKLNVAEVEAEAKKVVAALESIGKTVDSTGSVISSLFGLFKDLNGLDSIARNTIFDQIDKENERRDEALKQQKKLTDAQIELMRAQIKQYESGDALIKIDGAGLQPHLEAFMWEILKTIQVRVNRDGLAMLLGTP